MSDLDDLIDLVGDEQPFKPWRPYRNARKMSPTCPNGHLYTPENTRMVANRGAKPRRMCRQCIRTRQGKRT